MTLLLDLMITILTYLLNRTTVYGLMLIITI